jgi:signal transduction histidine kinase
LSIVRALLWVGRRVRFDALAGLKTSFGHPRGELAMLLLASFAIVCILVAVLSDQTHAALANEQLRIVLLAGLSLALAMIGATLLLRPRVRQRAGLPTDSADVAEMRRTLLATEAIINAEAQVLVFWEQGQRARLINHSLHAVPGVPLEPAEIERFGLWLEPTSSEELRNGLDSLFSQGRAFNLLVRTRSGAHLEADGRAAGGRAVLRLRDVVGYRKDLARIIDQHRQLKREIRSSRALLDALPMPVWMRDEKGRIAWSNSAYIKAVDAANFTEVRDGQLELLEGRDLARAQAQVAAGKEFRERLPIIIGAERKAHDVVVLPLEDTVVGAAVDVAAIEAAQDIHERQIAAYDRTLHRVATGVAMFGPDQRLVFFNEAFCRVWQLDAVWLEGRPSDGEILDRLRELSRLPQVVKYRDWRSTVLTKARTVEGYEDWWHLLDGRTVHLISELRPDGGVTYLFDDVTERLAQESRFKSLIEVQSETLDSLYEAVAVFSPDGRLSLFNSAFAKVWRLSRASLKEGPHIDAIIEQCKPLFSDAEIWGRMVQAVTGISDRRQPVEGQMERPGGSVIDFATVPLPDGATLITFADVTDARQAQRALIERNEALVAADRLKSQFIGHVSYELRSPLTNIIGFGDLLARPSTGALNLKQMEYLGDLTASSRTLLAIIDDILDLATIDAGGLELRVAPLNVQSVVDAAVLGVKERAQRARLKLDIRVQDSDVPLVADEARVRQVLYNLISNAIGFSNPGATVSVQTWSSSGIRHFVVEDQGVGIPQEKLARVLERFETHSPGGKHRGAGLGLAIVKSLVELHGGTLSLDSEPGRGTRVLVKMPENSQVRESLATHPAAATTAQRRAVS